MRYSSHSAPQPLNAAIWSGSGELDKTCMLLLNNCWQKSISQAWSRFRVCANAGLAERHAQTTSRPSSTSLRRRLSRPPSAKSPLQPKAPASLGGDLEDAGQLLEEALGCAAPRLLIERLHLSNLDLRLDVHLLHGPSQLPFAVDTSR